MDNEKPFALHRRLIWICVAAAATVVALFGGLWFLLAVGLRDIATNWIEDQRSSGWAIALDEPRLHGFPGWPKVDLTSVVVTAPLEDGGWTWQAEIITLLPATFDLTKLTVRAPGTHAISTPGMAPETWTAVAEQMDLEIDLDSSGKWQGAQLDLGDAELRDSAERPFIGVERIGLSLTLTNRDIGPNDVFTHFSAAADVIRLGMRVAPFERTVRAVRLDADLVGPIVPGRLSDALNAWRTGGGTLEVRRVLLDWPPLTIAADGTMALDNRLQPIGAFSTRITGFNDTLRAMESGGFIPHGQAASAQVILGLLAETPRGSDEPELAVPLSIQDQRLSIGPFDLMDVPDVRWE